MKKDNHSFCTFTHDMIISMVLMLYNLIKGIWQICVRKLQNIQYVLQTSRDLKNISTVV